MCWILRKVKPLAINKLLKSHRTNLITFGATFGVVKNLIFNEKGLEKLIRQGLENVFTR